jgi:hypothetical protein
MFAIWYRQRQRGSAAPGQPATSESSTPGMAGGALAVAAEQHFPVSVVAVHGLLAVTTVLLVFLTAIGVGE